MAGAAAVALTLALLASGCGSDPPPQPRTARERDSTLGASTAIPGAAGVRGALRVGDTATARNALRDSLAAEP